MNYLKWVALILKLIPCVIQVAKDIEDAKDDDDEVSIPEGIEIAENFVRCVLKKMGLDVDDDDEEKPVTE